MLWSYSNSEWTSVQPHADDEIAVFVDNGGGVFALDSRTGNPVWEQEVPIPPEVRHRRVPNTNVIAFGDLIIVSIWEIYAFDRETGNERWRYSPPMTFPATTRSWWMQVAGSSLPGGICIYWMPPPESCSGAGISESSRSHRYWLTESRMWGPGT